MSYWILNLFRVTVMVSLAALLISIAETVCRHRRAPFSSQKAWVMGLVFGVITVAVSGIITFVFDGMLITGRGILLLLTAVFFGWTAAAITGLMLVASLLAWGQFTLQALLTTLSLMAVGGVLKGRLKTVSVGGMVLPLAFLGFLTFAVTIFWNLVLGHPAPANDDSLSQSLWAFVLSPLATVLLGGMIQEDLNRSRREQELVEAKDSLTVQNEELTALYEEMTAAEETLQDQYDRLQEHQEALREANDRLVNQAYYDALTRLPNRIWFTEKLQAAVATAKETHGIGAIYYIGLDNFRAVNDTMGHTVGDQVLTSLAARLTAALEGNMSLARLGGDEFLVMVEDLPQQLEPVQVKAQELLSLIGEPIRLNNGSFTLTASIGTVLFPKDGQTVEQLLMNADMAMKKAKEVGRDRFVIFDDRMAKQGVRQLQMEVALRNAVANGELVLHYQPVYLLQDMSLWGYESLVRWNSPDFGFVPPAEFIHLAERNGQIVEIGQWVLEEACRFIRRCNAGRAAPVKVTVNLSPVQVLQQGFVQQVLASVEASAARRDEVMLEITETALMESFENSEKKLRELKQAGIGLSLDDFGTGYSSLNYLRTISVKTLKIDRSFITDLATDAKLQKMVRAIIGISHDLELSVVCEGVETVDQLMLLRDMGCDAVQGYLCSPPVREEEAVKLLEVNVAERFLKTP